MTTYGVLKTSTNTGVDSEISYAFCAPLQIISNQPAFISDTLNLRRKTAGQSVQRWEIEAQIEQTNDSANFMVDVLAKGYTDITYIRMPQIYRPASKKTTAGLTILVNGAFLAGQSTINVDVTGNGVWEWSAGEFIKFNGHTKVYCVINPGSHGVGTVITPPLVANIANDEPVYYGDANVTMRAYYDSNTRIGISYTDGILADPGTVRFVEAL